MLSLESVFSTVENTLSNPLILVGMLVGVVLLGAAGLVAARRWGWRPVPSVLAGMSLGAVLGVTLSRTRPDYASMPGVRVIEEPFCQLNGFSMMGGNELWNVLLFVPLVFFAVLATRRPLPVLASAIGLGVVIELVQQIANRGVCETQDLLNNVVGAVVAAAVAALLTRRRGKEAAMPAR
ncbi:VanZ family protein [Saccharopolyspora cebuensis]|uniref:VanZ family protein n=1 Tax=Saccharopolyspora cebuensis TaxID=418759 RepID=A0ABV4CEJ9_9PSEU